MMETFRRTLHVIDFSSLSAGDEFVSMEINNLGLKGDVCIDVPLHLLYQKSECLRHQVFLRDFR